MAPAASGGIAAAAETTTNEQLNLIPPRLAAKPLATIRLVELGEVEVAVNAKPEELSIEQLLDVSKRIRPEGNVSVKLPPDGIEFEVVKYKANA